MKSFFKNNSIILIPYLLVLGLIAYFLNQYKKTDIHLFLNDLVGTPLIDKFYYYITYLGDGNVAIVLLISILLYNIRLGIYVTLTFIVSTSISTILKHFVFDDCNRPFFIFTYFEKHTLRLVDGVDIFIHNSFPSGHATQAFAIFMSLAFCLPNKFIKILFFITACLTAYSRVYLSQHWLIDITAGSLLGFIISTLFYFLVFNNAKLITFNKSIFKLKKVD